MNDEDAAGMTIKHGQKVRVTSAMTGKGSSLKIYNMTMSCNHCSKPACLEACPYGAIDMANEPQEAPKGRNFKMAYPAQKCTMCADRQAEGKKPVCVDACIVRALDFGTKEYLESKYGKLDKEAAGFSREDTDPNFFFKAK